MVRQHVKPCSPFPGADSGAFVRRAPPLSVGVGHGSAVLSLALPRVGDSGR